MAPHLARPLLCLRRAGDPQSRSHAAPDTATPLRHDLIRRAAIPLIMRHRHERVHRCSFHRLSTAARHLWHATPGATIGWSDLCASLFGSMTRDATASQPVDSTCQHRIHPQPGDPQSRAIQTRRKVRASVPRLRKATYADAVLRAGDQQCLPRRLYLHHGLPSPRVTGAVSTTFPHSTLLRPDSAPPLRTAAVRAK